MVNTHLLRLQNNLSVQVSVKNLFLKFTATSQPSHTHNHMPWFLEQELKPRTCWMLHNCMWNWSSSMLYILSIYFPRLQYLNMLIQKTLSKFILALFKSTLYFYQRFRYSLLNKGFWVKNSLRTAVIYRDTQLHKINKIKKNKKQVSIIGHYWKKSLLIHLQCMEK